MHDAEADHIAMLAGASIWPLLAALATTGMFIGSIFTPWALVWGAIPVAMTLVGWFWPRADETNQARAIEVKPGADDRQRLLGETLS
jgi:cytochrome c oxidase subunit 1